MRQMFLLFSLGFLLLVPALFVAQTFLGTHAGFALLSAIPQASGAVKLGVMSFCGALLAALPFGLLFGLTVPGHSRVQAFCLSALPAVSLLAFSVWVRPQAEMYPIWFVRATDAVFFVVLFLAFAALGARMRSPGQRQFYRWSAGMFAGLALIYFFAPQIYYAYFYLG